MGEAPVLGRTSGAGLLVTHSSSEPELLLSESDESLHEDPDELPPLVEDPDELLELRLLLGLFAVSTNLCELRDCNVLLVLHLCMVLTSTKRVAESKDHKYWVSNEIQRQLAQILTNFNSQLSPSARSLGPITTTVPPTIDFPPGISIDKPNFLNAIDKPN